MDDVDELIDRCREKLGEPDGVYRPKPLARRVLGGGALAVGGTVGGGLLLWAAPGAAGAVGKFLVAAPVLGGMIVWQAVAARGRAVLTYPDGLLPVGRGEVNWLPWDALGPVTLKAKQGEPAGDHIAVPPAGPFAALAKLTVGTDGGPPLVFRPALVGYEKLAARVQRERFARQWPAVRERFDAGETVGFGAFDLHLDGVGRGRKVLPWGRVGSVRLKGGRVLVKRTGRWLSWAAVGLDKVPDPHLFFALAEYARRTGGARG